ncbi:MAG: O-antigen ligase family protein [Candidatus Omnitrophota bacterium]
MPFKKIHGMNPALILFSLALVISTLFSPDKLNSLNELSKYMNNLLLFIVIASFTAGDKIRVIRAVVLAGLIISVLAIYQYFFGFRHLLSYIAKDRNTSAFTLDYIMRKRVFFPFVTPNILGGYLAMIIPLSLLRKNKLWYILPLLAALLLTKSLSALLSIFLALMVYYYLSGRLKKEGVFFLLGLAVIIGLIFAARSIAQKQHLQPAFSAMMRLNYWRETLRIIKTAPLTGIGLGNFNLPESRYAHNSYLQIWAETGIIGIASFLWIIFALWKKALKKIKNSPDKNQSACLIAASVALCAHNLFDFSFYLPEASLLWWAIGGLILAENA